MAIIDNWKGKSRADQKRITRWTVDYRTAAGARRRQSFDLKDDAEEFESKQRRLRRQGAGVDTKAAQRITVAELWGDPLAPVEGSFIRRVKDMGVRGGSPASPKTLTKYENCRKLYIMPRWGDTPIGSVRLAEVSDWITGLTDQSGKPASAYLKRETAGIFRSLMDHAVRHEYLPRNPALDPVGRADYRPAPVKQKPHVYLSMPHLRRLASHCEGFESLILTAGLGGLRFGELTALTVGDLELGDKPMIRVTKAFTDDRGTLHLKSTKTGENRDVPLPRIVGDLLALEIEGREPTERVWSAPRGGVIRHGSFTKANSRFDKAIAGATESAKADGETFPDLTFHDLRHTAVSLAIKAGANVKVVQAIAGHSSATITLDTYAGLFTDDLHDSAARLNAELAKHW